MTINRKQDKNKTATIFSRKDLTHDNVEKVLILNDIRSVINVGAIFRTADAIGINKIFLCGYTPSPVDRFGRDRKDFAKASLGSEKMVRYETVHDVFDLISKLKKEDFKVIALEQSENSVDYKNVEIKQKTAIILGNEVAGVDKNILKQCDVVLEIPMFGQKESLNVSVATGILLFRLFDK